MALNMTAMDYRQYDNAIGRFNSVDPLAEMSYSMTPYHFGNGNPIYFNDPSGLISEALLDTIWNLTPEGGSTTWVNGGNGSFDNIDGSGWVNDSEGVYHQNTEYLPEVVLNYGSAYNNAIMLQDHVYKSGRFYQYFRDQLASDNMDNVQSTLDYLGTVPVFGEVFDGLNAGISALRGDYVSAGLSVAAMVPIWGWAATGLKQSHHIIPKAVFRDLINDIGHLVERDGIKNLMDLPVPFHGNHPQYNTYVRNALGDLKDRGLLSPASIEGLQGELRGMINEALESGQKLNDYFRPLAK